VDPSHWRTSWRGDRCLTLPSWCAKVPVWPRGPARNALDQECLLARRATSARVEAGFESSVRPCSCGARAIDR
jgi:hypothetical protein